MILCTVIPIHNHYTNPNYYPNHNFILTLIKITTLTHQIMLFKIVPFHNLYDGSRRLHSKCDGLPRLHNLREPTTHKNTAHSFYNYQFLDDLPYWSVEVWASYYEFSGQNQRCCIPSSRGLPASPPSMHTWIRECVCLRA